MSCPFCQLEHNFSVAEAIDQLAAGPAKVRAALAGASAEAVNWAPPKAWSAKQVAVHLLDTELVYGVRFRKILSDDDGVLLAYDQDSWTAACTEGRDLASVLDTFEMLRKDNVGLLRAATAKAANLDRSGKHPGYGTLTLRQVLLHLAPHDEKHSGQIQRTLTKFRESGQKK